jgi:hypothetical protein
MKALLVLKLLLLVVESRSTFGVLISDELG